MPSSNETFISVDVETAGPYPARYSLLSVGACLVGDPEQGFYAELRPLSREALAPSLRVSRLSLESLSETGREPAEAMRGFADWIRQVTPAGSRPVMVAFNAPFDWSFIDHYFLLLLGENPFGHTALDIKAFYMGMTGCAWDETSIAVLSPRYLHGQELPHNALADARMQAGLFRRLLAQARGEKVNRR